MSGGWATDDDEPVGDRTAEREAANAIRQFRRVLDLIGVVAGHPERITPAIVAELNALAVEALIEHPGQYRDGPAPIEGSAHEPPDHGEVPGLVDAMCLEIAKRWEDDPVQLAAYALWRINWIHPFEDGNGRTARAVAYLIVCAKHGGELPGERALPERIKDEKQKYWRCLEQADDAWKRRRLDVSHLRGFLAKHLRAQLAET